MTFGPELTPEEAARRRAVVLKIGAVLVPAIFAFVVFAAFGGIDLVLSLIGGS